MIIESLIEEIQAKLKTGITVCQDRVYAVSSVYSLMSLKALAMPMIGIVPQGGTHSYQKYKFENHHLVTIFIVDAIHREDEVILGGSNKKGLLRLQKDVYDLLKIERFATELSNAIQDVRVTDMLPVMDYVEAERKRFFASIGLKLDYLEITT